VFHLVRLSTLRWLGVVALGAIAGVCLLSSAYHFTLIRPRWDVSLSDGTLWTSLSVRERRFPAIPELPVSAADWRPPLIERVPFHLSLGWPGVWKEPHGVTIVLPLWLLFAVVACPTAVAWHFSARRLQADECAKCGYSLTGNVSGVCPECGAEIGDRTIGTITSEKTGQVRLRR
jgi:hypothetical protein